MPARCLTDASPSTKLKFSVEIEKDMIKKYYTKCSFTSLLNSFLNVMTGYMVFLNAYKYKILLLQNIWSPVGNFKIGLK